jgi:TldD protein
MSISRRDFMKAGVTVAAAVAVPRPLLIRFGAKAEPVPPIDDRRFEELVGRALDAARAAGAGYADVRLTHDRTRSIDYTSNVQETEDMVVGVRALVNGYWGFASGPVWSADEMARLGREAVVQGKTNALGKARIVELAPVTTVKDGHWVMPIRIDPFDVAPIEIADYLAGLRLFAVRTPGVSVIMDDCSLFTQEKAFGSTAGSYCTQRTYLTSGTFVMSLEQGEKRGGGSLDGLSPAGMGWELYRDQPLREAIERLIDEVKADMRLPVKPVDVGRYDMVFDARSVANLVHGTLGPATELDRALGYEANAGGTSYLDDPLHMVGSYQAGAPSLTVTANRSEPGACATVKWDDEGVTPDEFTLVKDGVLVDYQTTRESARWLEAYYGKRGTSLRSHGCAAAPSGIFAPLQHAPNLVMGPGKDALDFDALVTGLTTGIAMKEASFDMDFQKLNGLGTGRAYEIKGGKRVAVIGGAGVLARAPELWKALLAVGGRASARRIGLMSEKGEPTQRHVASVTAPPAIFKQLTVIDPLRKA